MQGVERESTQDGQGIEQLRRRVTELEEQLADREQKLQESQYAIQDMRDMIDRIGDVFFAVDREWQYLYVNPKAAILANVTPDNLLGKTLWETFPQLLGTTYEEEYRRAMEHQIPVHVEAPGVISGRWYETFVYPSPRGLSFYGRDITARKEAEEALHKNKEQTERQLAELKAVYATVPAGLCYLNTDLRYVSVNDRLAHWAGITPADLVGRTLGETAPESASQFIRSMRHVIQTGEPLINQEHRASLQFEPDRMRDWLLNYYPVHDSNGKIIGVNAVVQDVTDLRQSQREREEALALLDAFFSLAPVGLAFMDQDLRFVRINEALAAINGLPAEEHLGKRPTELTLNIDNLPEILQIWQKVLNGQTVRGVEISGETPAAPGVIRYWLEHWYPVRIGESVIGMGVIAEEITERKLYEQSLQQSEERFRQLADAMPQLVWTANPDGKVDYYNQRRQEFLGFAKTGRGWQWSPALHPEDQQRTVEAWQQAVATGKVYSIEHRVCRANGEYEWYLSRAVPARNANGQIIKWYGTATNIHKHKIAASEREYLLAELQQERAHLQELTATLEDRVHKGTEQIRVLAAHLNLAEHAERKRVAQILHDHVQQMLYAVQMRIHLLEMDLSSGRAVILQSHVDEMKRLTDEAIHALRTLSVELSPPILENEGLPEAIRWLSQQMAESHGLRISLSVEGDCRVEDKNLRVMLFQAGRELLFNVVKHAQVQEASLALKHIDGQIVITVSDQGPGMDPNVLAGNSDGFGLSSIRERLSLFNGHMQIESALDQGTRVIITCPL